MKKINYPFLIGLVVLLIDVILCFSMLYSGHLGYWQFLNELFAIYYFVTIIILFVIGMSFIFWSHALRRFSNPYE